MVSNLFSKIKENVRTVQDSLKENANYLKYNIEKQPIVEKIRNIAYLDLIEENANYVKNQTLDKYFEIVDKILDKDVMNELIKSDKLNSLEDKLDLLNNIRTCLVNLFQTTLYQNLNDLIKVVANYINLIDSTIIKLELNEEVDLSFLRYTIRDVLKFVLKFSIIFDENDYKCEKINIF